MSALDVGCSLALDQLVADCPTPRRYHTGAATGASSVLWVKPAPRQDPDRPRGVCVAVLANCMDVYGDITELAASIGAQFVDY